MLPDRGTFRLSLAGTRRAPDPFALALAKELPARFPSVKPDIEHGMFEHYEPYREACNAGEYPGRETCPDIARPDLVWPHVTPVHVLIEPIGGVLTVEIAFGVAWDEEHTVAALFQDWRFVGFNGSVRAR